MGNGELKKTEGSFQGSMKFDCLEVGVAKGMLKRRFVAHRRVVFVGNAFTPSNVALRGPRYSEEFVIKCQWRKQIFLFKWSRNVVRSRSCIHMYSVEAEKFRESERSEEDVVRGRKKRNGGDEGSNERRKGGHRGGPSDFRNALYIVASKGLLRSRQIQCIIEPRRTRLSARIYIDTYIRGMTVHISKFFSSNALSFSTT